MQRRSLERSPGQLQVYLWKLESRCGTVGSTGCGTEKKLESANKGHRASERKMIIWSRNIKNWFQS